MSAILNTVAKVAIPIGAAASFLQYSMYDGKDFVMGLWSCFAFRFRSDLNNIVGILQFSRNFLLLLLLLEMKYKFFQE
jgi:hypothetical protein